jgi:hypothetical protein
MPQYDTVPAGSTDLASNVAQRKDGGGHAAECDSSATLNLFSVPGEANIFCVR